MDSFWSKLVILLVGFIIYLLCLVHNASHQKRLLELVEWCRQERLDVQIRGFQRELSIPPEYCIDSELEESYVIDILSSFVAELEALYFQQKLLPIRSVYVVSGKHYFAKMLWSYCYSHCCESSIAGHKMHGETISHTRYDESIEFDATYSLSDFAVTYFKLYYISFCFLGNSPIFNKRGRMYQDASFIKNCLDTRCIPIRSRQQL